MLGFHLETSEVPVERVGVLKPCPVFEHKTRKPLTTLLKMVDLSDVETFHNSSVVDAVVECG
jgi:hypothetical protein